MVNFLWNNKSSYQETKTANTDQNYDDVIWVIIILPNLSSSYHIRNVAEFPYPESNVEGMVGNAKSERNFWG